MDSRAIMKSQIVVDGPERMKQSAEYQARLRQLRRSIHLRYAPELSRAGFLRQTFLRLRMEYEFRRERRRMGPSPHSV